MPNSLPPFFGIPRALDAAGLLQTEGEDYSNAARRSGDVMNNNSLRERVLSVLGFWPTANETLGQFWKRQTPNSLPPGLEFPQGHDIALEPDNKNAPAKAGLNSLRRKR